MSHTNGETDLERLLATLTVSRRSDEYVVIPFPATAVERGSLAVGDGIDAVMVENEAVTVVATGAAAAANNWPQDRHWAWLTIDVHSSLEAVGLTAALANALTALDIPCNVIAAYYHDHLLVPVDRADEATAGIDALRRQPDARPPGGS
jgi:hypothetical protein